MVTGHCTRRVRVVSLGPGMYVRLDRNGVAQHPLAQRRPQPRLGDQVDRRAQFRFELREQVRPDRSGCGRAPGPPAGLGRWPLSASPRATDPNTRTLRAPCRAARSSSRPRLPRTVSREHHGPTSSGNREPEHARPGTRRQARQQSRRDPRQHLIPGAPPRSRRRRSSSSSSSPRTRAWPRRRPPPSPRSARAA